MQSGHLSFILFSLHLGGLASITTPLVKFLEPYLLIEHLLMPMSLSKEMWHAIFFLTFRGREAMGISCEEFIDKPVVLPM